MPLGHGLPALGEHLVPVLHFHRAALRTEYQLTDLVVPTQPVVVHDADDEARVSDAFVRHAERERFVEDRPSLNRADRSRVLRAGNVQGWIVEDRVERLLVYDSLLLLHLLAVVHHPDLHVRVYTHTHTHTHTHPSSVDEIVHSRLRSV